MACRRRRVPREGLRGEGKGADARERKSKAVPISWLRKARLSKIRQTLSRCACSEKGPREKQTRLVLKGEKDLKRESPEDRLGDEGKKR